MISQSLIDDLEDAIASGSREKRLNTLRRVTDLFVLGASQYSDEQVGIFDDVIDRLARQIEVDARVQLAKRLAPIANAPVKVIHALADDVIDVAGPVLAESTRLSDQELIAYAYAKSQDHLLAISKRGSLSEAVTDVLVERGDTEVVRSVARNEGARFSDSGFGILVKRSEGDDVLAEHVGLRQDLPRHHLHGLLVKASGNVLKKLTKAHPHLAHEVEHVLQGITGRIEAEAASHEYADAKIVVEALHRSGELGEEQILTFTRMGRQKEAMVALSVLSALPIEGIERAMLDDQTDMVLIAAKAASLSWATTKSFVLMQASGRGLSQADLDRVRQSFERLQVNTAQRVVRFYQVRQGAAKGMA
jgi:uncharacterized protein (DUF2336 family)